MLISGWWYTYPSEKYESQLGSLFPIYGKIKTCSKPPTIYIYDYFIFIHILYIYFRMIKYVYLGKWE